ncbi:hypothetical protein Baya_14919 [Bagarius yarrelli]|uniref:Uncharacterized protein n=1 Tax=Bagarius yarrelli TaxID=175774 RepID=A0A556VAB8_BAGYA|nr:hypothetical protein Baya_14919 [Bagarius yarrelli]
MATRSWLEVHSSGVRKCLESLCLSHLEPPQQSSCKGLAKQRHVRCADDASSDDLPKSAEPPTAPWHVCTLGCYVEMLQYHTHIAEEAGEMALRGKNEHVSVSGFEVCRSARGAWKTIKNHANQGACDSLFVAMRARSDRCVPADSAPLRISALESPHGDPLITCPSPPQNAPGSEQSDHSQKAEQKRGVPVLEAKKRKP